MITCNCDRCSMATTPQDWATASEWYAMEAWLGSERAVRAAKIGIWLALSGLLWAAIAVVIILVVR